MLPADEEARRRGHVGHEIWRRAGALGFLCADIPEAHGGGRRRLPPRGGVLRGDGAARAHRHGDVGALDRRPLLPQPRHRGAEAALPAPAGARRARRRDRDDRARRRFRPAGRGHAGRAARRSLRHQRQQDLHHQRLSRRRRPRRLQDRSGAGRPRHVHPDRRDRRARRLPRRPPARQDRHEGPGHLGALLRRRRGAASTTSSAGAKGRASSS